MRLYKKNILSPPILIIAVSLICSISGCKKEKDAGQPVIATIGDKKITMAEFRGLLEREREEKKEEGEIIEIKSLKEDVLGKLVQEKLFLIQAEKIGMSHDEKEIDTIVDQLKEGYSEKEFKEVLGESGITEEEWIESIKNNLIEKQVIKEIIHPQIKIAEGDVAGYYKRNKDLFAEPEMIRARQIVMREKDEAEKVFSLLQEGKDFGKLAKKYSISPDREEGGDLGYFPRGEYPKVFDDVCFSLPIGATSRVITSEYGYHIFQILDKKPPRKIPFEEVRSNIETILKGEKEQALLSEWLNKLRAETPVNINKKLMEKML